MLVINALSLKSAGYRICGLWLLALVAILFVDKPLTLYIHHLRLDQLLWLRHISEGLLVPLSTLAILALFVSKIKSSKVQALALGAYFYLSLKLTLELKSGLKIVFGRYWPKTWINNNLSLIHDGVYGFHWLQGFGNQGSFPSGHSTYVVFCCVWLYLLMPRLRYFWVSLAVLVIMVLISLDYHFLGDCLAGAGLGYFCAILSAYLAQRALKHCK